MLDRNLRKKTTQTNSNYIIFSTLNNMERKNKLNQILKHIMYCTGRITGNSN